MSASHLQRFKAKAKDLQIRLTPAPKPITALDTIDNDDRQDDSKETPFDPIAIATINIWHSFSADSASPQLSQEVFRRVSEDKMIQLINEGVDLNRHIPEIAAPLLVAVQGWLQASDREPLYRGLDLNMHDSRGKPPLGLLVIEATDKLQNLYTQEGVKDEFLKLLLEIWAQLDQTTTETGCNVQPVTPLIAAVQTGSEHSFHLLLSRDINNISRADCITALYVSASGSLRRPEYPERQLSRMNFDLKCAEELQMAGDRISRKLISDFDPAIERLLTEAYEEYLPVRLSDDDQELDQMNSIDSRSVESYNEFLEGLDKLIVTESPSLGDKNSDTKLCLSCQDFQRRAVNRQWFLHSPTAKDLELSVSAGCVMCQLIKDSLLEGLEQVYLYYFSVPPASLTEPTNYYERILVRGHRKGGLSNGQGFIFGELSLAMLDERTSDMLYQARHLNDATNNSECSFQMIAHWLQTCLTQHSTCYHSRDILPALPTRVVDVGPSDSSQKPRLLITEGLQGLYVALSYCWGDRTGLTTTMKTLQAYQKSIPFSIIPRTLRDALNVTRQLGIRYLWVDTLCIIQDSTEDWLRESKNMANIYQQSVLTIAAADSEDSEGGLFRRRRRLRTRPVHFAPVIASFKNSDQVFTFGDRQTSKDALRCESRLDRRGWVLQEQLLSPRTLNFSSQELYWECSTLNASESYPAGIPVDYDHIERQRFAELKRKLAVSNVTSDQERVHVLWQNIVTIYSRRELTQETDKLVALSGAASQLANVFGDRLLAGLWVKWLWCDLLWLVDQDISSTTEHCVRSAEFKAPSWSWASIKGPISFKHPWGTGYTRFYPCIQVLELTEKVESKPNSVSGSITLRGIVVPELHFPPMEVRGSTSHRNPIYREASEESMQARYWKPDIKGTAHKNAQYLIIAASQAWAVCLGIASTGRKESEYKRVGLAYWWLPPENPIPAHLQTQVLTLV